MASIAVPVLFVSPIIISGDESETPYVADVFVCDGRIAAIGPKAAEQARSHKDLRVVQGQDQTLSPGFIDMHAHSDLYLLTDPTHAPKITQGVTTEVVGQDGISYAPVRTTEQMQAIRDQIAGWNGNPSDEECAQGGVHDGKGMFEWRTIKEYLDTLDRNNTATNVAMLVPQGNLRLLACGPEDIPATPEQMDEQVALLRAAMADGAVGMSSGLTYTPGMYAPTEELAVLCHELTKSFPGSYYAPHTRSYGKNALGAYAEMIGLSRDTRCPVHLTHATMNFPENEGRANELLALVNNANNAGGEITLDTYPYLAGSTTLASLLPSWASSGGPSATLRRLADPELVEKMRNAVDVIGSNGNHGLVVDWQTIEIAGIAEPSLASYSRHRVAEIAKDENRPPSDVFFDILRKDRLRTSIMHHIGNEPNVRTIMAHSRHTGGSDGILHGSHVHPRAWGTFPRFLGHYARDEGITSIPEMVAHITSRPAKRIGIFPERGIVREGSAADLVLWSQAKIKDQSTYTDPKMRSVGITAVLVNGVFALDDGKLTEARAGRTLRRQGDGKVRPSGVK